MTPWWISIVAAPLPARYPCSLVSGEGHMSEEQAHAARGASVEMVHVRALMDAVGVEHGTLVFPRAVSDEELELVRHHLERQGIVVRLDRASS